MEAIRFEGEFKDGSRWKEGIPSLPSWKQKTLAYLAGSRKNLKRENGLALERTKIGDRRKSDVN